MKVEDDLQFFEILHDILENPLYSKILSWTDDRTFEIKNIELFISIVLSRFFENETYETFLSQLSSNQFKKTQETSTSQFFTHPTFRKSNRSLPNFHHDDNENDTTTSPSPPTPTTATTTTTATAATTPTPRKQGAAFLEKLFDILEDSTYEDCISWCDDGKSVLVKKVEEFSQVVLPKYYKHNNFQSFVRQLNMYNFCKTSHDANWREFKQPLFRKGKRSLLSLITRKTQQKNQNDKERNQSHSDTSSEQNSNFGGKADGIGINSHKSASTSASASTFSFSNTIDMLNGNVTNADLINVILELQNKLYHMESRITILEDQIGHCPHYLKECTGQEEIAQNSPSSLSIQSIPTPNGRFNFTRQSFRDNPQSSIPSTRQNSENGSLCSDLGSLISTRSRSSTFTEKPHNEGVKKEKVLHSFDGTYLTSFGGAVNNRMEGVALQRRNRSISIGYDSFEPPPNPNEIFESGVDAILTAAAAVAQRGLPHEDVTENTSSGRPLKKMKTFSDNSLPAGRSNTTDEGTSLQRKASLSAPFEGLVLSKLSSMG